MKKVIIGGFVSLIGVICGIATMLVVGNNMVSGWYTPPGRLLTTVFETGMTIPIFFSFILLLIGFLILGVEYFRKDE